MRFVGAAYEKEESFDFGRRSVWPCHQGISKCKGLFCVLTSWTMGHGRFQLEIDHWGISRFGGVSQTSCRYDVTIGFNQSVYVLPFASIGKECAPKPTAESHVRLMYKDFAINLFAASRESIFVC